MPADTADTAEYLTLKWGVPKSWHLKTDATRDLLRRYAALGWSESAMMQPNSDEHRRVLCDLIDAINADTIENDWTGEAMTKEAAKAYVMEYRRG